MLLDVRLVTQAATISYYELSAGGDEYSMCIGEPDAVTQTPAWAELIAGRAHGRAGEVLAYIERAGLTRRYPEAVAALLLQERGLRYLARQSQD